LSEPGPLDLLRSTQGPAVGGYSRSAWQGPRSRERKQALKNLTTEDVSAALMEYVPPYDCDP